MFLLGVHSELIAAIESVTTTVIAFSFKVGVFLTSIFHIYSVLIIYTVLIVL